MQIVAVGVSHKSTTITLREQLTVSGDELPVVLARLREHVGEAFILSTCNRVEVYAVCGHEASGADRLRQFLASLRGASIESVRGCSYTFGHRAAAHHLLRVAAGLDSAIVGEQEILGQVRRALAAARQASTLGPLLDRLGDAALACGKRVRALTTIGRARESVASLGLRLLARDRGSLEGASVIVLGAGETAAQVLACLTNVPGVQATVLNRTVQHAASIAAQHRAIARPWQELDEALAMADIVIGCTASPTPLIEATTLSRARGANPGVLYCLDLGVPRDLGPDVTALPWARVIDLPRIEAEAAAFDATQAQDIAHAEAVVELETERFMKWWCGRGVASTVTRLHARADSIRQAEIDRALLRLPGLSPQARDVVRDLAARIVAKLLHEPTIALKHDPEGENMAVVVERLFALGAIDDAEMEAYAARHTDAAPVPHPRSLAS